MSNPRRSERARIRQAWIYFIQADEGPVKVGIAATPTDRMASFQTGNHHKLRLVHKIWGTWYDEQRIQRLIQPSLQIRSEWFDSSILDALIPLEFSR